MFSNNWITLQRVLYSEALSQSNGLSSFTVLNLTSYTNFTNLFGPARTLSTNPYDVYHFWVYSE